MVLNNSKSTWSEVISGVLRESVSGPILFILYINDLPDVISCVYRSVDSYGDSNTI